MHHGLSVLSMPLGFRMKPQPQDKPSHQLPSTFIKALAQRGSLTTPPGEQESGDLESSETRTLDQEPNSTLMPSSRQPLDSMAGIGNDQLSLGLQLNTLQKSMAGPSSPMTTWTDKENVHSRMWCMMIFVCKIAEWKIIKLIEQMVPHCRYLLAGTCEATSCSKFDQGKHFHLFLHFNKPIQRGWFANISKGLLYKTWVRMLQQRNFPTLNDTMRAYIKYIKNKESVKEYGLCRSDLTGIPRRPISS